MSKKHILNIHSILLVIGISFQLVWIFSLILAKYVSQVEKGEVGLDFLVYYSAGHIIHYNSPAQLYDLQLQRKVQATIIPHISQERFYPYNHPPILAPLMGWVVTNDYSASYLRWVLILILFQIISVGIIIRLMCYLKWKKTDILLTALSGLLFYPAFVAFIRGQDSSFLLLGICLWVLGVMTSSDRVAGLGLALAVIRPQIALVLVIPFIFKRRWVWWWFMIWGFIILIFSYLFIGSEGLSGLVKVLVLSGQGLGFDVEKMATLMGAILRWFPGIDPRVLHTMGYFGYVLAIIFLCAVWFKSLNIGFKQINIAILTAILFAPHLHGHDLTILLVPAIGAVFRLSENKVFNLKTSTMLPMVVSILLIVADMLTAIIVVYLVIISLALISWRPELLVHIQQIRKVDG
jgi:hypothetical protein